ADAQLLGRARGRQHGRGDKHDETAQRRTENHWHGILPRPLNAWPWRKRLQKSFIAVMHDGCVAAICAIGGNENEVRASRPRREAPYGLAATAKRSSTPSHLS